MRRWFPPLGGASVLARASETTANHRSPIGLPPPVRQWATTSQRFAIERARTVAGSGFFCGAARPGMPAIGSGGSSEMAWGFFPAAFAGCAVLCLLFDWPLLNGHAVAAFGPWSKAAVGHCLKRSFGAGVVGCIEAGLNKPGRAPHRTSRPGAASAALPGRHRPGWQTGRQQLSLGFGHIRFARAVFANPGCGGGHRPNEESEARGWREEGGRCRP